MSWIDQLGVKRIIYPTNNLTTNPYNTFLQDTAGQPTQDNLGENVRRYLYNRGKMGTS